MNLQLLTKFFQDWNVCEPNKNLIKPLFLFYFFLLVLSIPLHHRHFKHQKHAKTKQKKKRESYHSLLTWPFHNTLNIYIYAIKPIKPEKLLKFS